MPWSVSRCGCAETTGATPALSRIWAWKSVIHEIKRTVSRHRCQRASAGFLGPANPHLELTGLILGDTAAGGKGGLGWGGVEMLRTPLPMPLPALVYGKHSASGGPCPRFPGTPMYRRGALLMNVCRRVRFCLWLSPKHPSDEMPRTGGPQCYCMSWLRVCVPCTGHSSSQHRDLGPNGVAALQEPYPGAFL